VLIYPKQMFAAVGKYKKLRHPRNVIGAGAGVRHRPPGRKNIKN